MPADTTGSAPLHIGCVALAVQDSAAVEAFYRDVISLQVVARDAGVTRLGAGDTVLLELLEHPDALRDDPQSAGLFHTAFLLPTRTDLANWLGHLVRLQYPVDGASDHTVSEAIYLSDPEGNGVEVYADRPRASWQWNGSEIDMGTLRLDTAALLALQTADWAGVPAATRIGHLHLRVGGIEQAAAFYSGVLGLDVTKTVNGAVFMSSGGYHHHIAANSWRSGGASMRDPAMAGLAFATLEVTDADTLAAIADRSGQPDIGTNGLRDPWGTELRFRIAA